MPPRSVTRGEKRARDYSHYLYDFSIDGEANTGHVVRASRINSVLRSQAIAGNFSLSLLERSRVFLRALEMSIEMYRGSMIDSINRDESN